MYPIRTGLRRWGAFRTHFTYLNRGKEEPVLYPEKAAGRNPHSTRKILSLCILTRIGSLKGNSLPSKGGARIRGERVQTGTPSMKWKNLESHPERTTPFGSAFWEEAQDRQELASAVAMSV